MDTTEHKDNNNQELLRLLSIFHYVVGAIGLLFSCIPFFHLIVGLIILFSGGKAGPPALIGLFFVVFASAFILVGWGVSLAILFAGRKLQLRESYQYCFVIGCVECVFFPFGTVLGVFTVILLNKDSVRALFDTRR